MKLYPSGGNKCTDSWTNKGVGTQFNAYVSSNEKDMYIFLDYITDYLKKNKQKTSRALNPQQTRPISYQDTLSDPSLSQWP